MEICAKWDRKYSMYAKGSQETVRQILVGLHTKPGLIYMHSTCSNKKQ